MGLQARFEGGVQALAPRLEGSAHDVAALADLWQGEIMVLGRVSHATLAKFLPMATLGVIRSIRGYLHLICRMW